MNELTVKLAIIAAKVCAETGINLSIFGGYIFECKNKIHMNNTISINMSTKLAMSIKGEFEIVSYRLIYDAITNNIIYFRLINSSK